jgi:hypothetical protein
MALALPYPAPTCPNCGKSLLMARAIPRDEGVIELHIYECRVCRLAVTQAASETIETQAAC